MCSQRIRPSVSPFLSFLFAAGAHGLAHASDGETVALRPSDGAAGDRFGLAVAIEGDLVVVGAPGDDDLGSDSGSAYLFDRATGQLAAKLSASDGAPGAEFGWPVATDGARVLVGALGGRSAYLFDAATGTEQARLAPADTGGKNFASSVAVAGAYTLVGASFDLDLGDYAGAVYLFDTATGGQVAKLYGSDTDEFDQFGRAVAISGGTGLVGARALGAMGAVYLFDLATGLETAKLVAADGTFGDEFGMSVAADGGLAVIGAPFDTYGGSDLGSAYLFDVASGQELAKLLPVDDTPVKYFGNRVAIDGATVVVSAQGSADAGAAYVFDVSDPLQPVQVAKLVASDAAPHDRLGLGLDVSGPSIAAGVMGDDEAGSDSGSLYLFGPLPLAGASYCGPAVPNSSGASATLEAQGSSVASHDYLALRAADLPQHQFGMFLASMTQGSVVPPGSQGNLCLGGGIGRYKEHIQDTGEAGSLSLQLDLTHTPTPQGPVAIQAGETWFFQAWFRDMNPGTTSNFTDAVAVSFS